LIAALILTPRLTARRFYWCRSLMKRLDKIQIEKKCQIKP